LKFPGLVNHPLFQSLLILGLVRLCFGGIIQGYFLADDISQVNYISNIVNGHWETLAHNFTGNFLDIPSSSLYRPLIVVSMVSDFLLWKTAATGWFITNLLFYTADAFLVVLLAKAFESSSSSGRFTLVCTAMFVVYPLHGEPVCWLAGRSDLICTFWFLFSLLTAIKAIRLKSRTSQIVSLIAFILALLSKEMSVVLPGVIVLYACLFCENGDQKLAKRLLHAAKVSLPYWVLLILYFVLRVQFLGTLTGGYTDAVGLTMQSTLAARLVDWKNIYRIFFPFRENFYLYPVGICLSVICYSLALFSVQSAKVEKLTIFLLCWLLLSLLPIVPMWGLGANLEASRIYFLASIPFLMLIANLMTSIPKRLVCAFCSITLIFVWATSSSDICHEWTAAGKIVKNIGNTAIQLCNSRPGRFAILPLPKEKNGTLLVTNGGMFLRLLQPPYQEKSYAGRFIVFDRIFTEPDQVINASRLKKVLSENDVTGPYIWKNNGFDLIPLSKQCPADLSTPSLEIAVKSSNNKLLKGVSGNEVIVITNDPELQYLEISKLSINPLQADFLQFDIESVGDQKFHYAYASWGLPEFSSVPTDNGISSGLYVKTRPVQTVTIPLSHQWKWFATPRLSNIRIALPSEKNAKLSKIRFVRAEEVAPQLTFKGTEYGPRGICYLNDGQASISVNGCSLKDAKHFLLQRSKTNYFFDSFTSDRQTEAVGKSIILKSAKSVVTINSKDLRERGYYQFRCRALDASACPLGAWSDSLTFYVP